MSDETTNVATEPSPVASTVASAKATKLTTEHKKGNLYKFDPFDVLIDETARGRHLPPTDEQVTQLALSMAEHGQITPINHRPQAGTGKAMVTAGFTRLEAARLLRKGFHATVDEVNEAGEVTPTRKHIHKPDFLIESVQTKESDAEAFIRNIVENAHRNQTTLIDDAYNQEKLRQQPYGFTDRKIAAIFGVTPARVSQLKAYLEMPEEVQNLVHEGRISGTAAELLDQLPQEQWQEIVDKIKAGISVPTAEIKAGLRKYLQSRPRVRNKANGSAADATEGDTSANGTAAGSAETGEGTETDSAEPAEKKPGRKSAADKADDSVRLDLHEVMHQIRQMTHKDVFEACPQLHETMTILRNRFLGNDDENMMFSKLEKVFNVKLPDPAALTF
jgi:ParB-like chromosome segregation protein Spo0J